MHLPYDYYITMRNPIKNDIKDEILRQWLLGLQRDRIATSLGVSVGAVSNIISQCKAQIGVPMADTLRDFSTQLREFVPNAPEKVLSF